MSYTPSYRQLNQRAKEMRKNMTDEERILWKRLLQNYIPRFHRQHIIDPYIVDFYCPKLKFIVEVDGCQHYTEEMLIQDEIRTRYIESKGNMLIRISNGDIMGDYENTLSYVHEMFKKRAETFGIDIGYKKEY